MIRANRATIVELDTVLGAEDLYDLVEIILVDAENSRRYQRWLDSPAGRR